MSWTVKRYRLGETLTDGQFLVPEHGINLATLERPWLPGFRGGQPFKSCVPDGVYNLIRHTRENGDHVFALRNSDLGVYYRQGEVPDEGGRYLVLAHSANWLRQIVGCLAVGMERIIDDEGRPMVTNSRKAMALLMGAFDADNPLPGPVTTELLITTEPGARN